MAEPLIRVTNLSFSYRVDSSASIPALCGVDLSLQRGEYLTIAGHNGSGKSTLAKCLNGLLQPTEGEVWVLGWNTCQAERLFDIRAAIGMVFQNPDNQFVASVVEEEVAFGPENLGLPRGELRQRVDAALQATGLQDARGQNPHTLSAGQKSRLAIAGILAMGPACLVLDESTAMLDPLARREVLALLRSLHRGGLAIVAITHYMDEVAEGEHVIVLEQGRIALQGTPRQVFSRADELERIGLALPPAAAIARGLRRRGAPLPDEIATPEDLLQALQEHMRAPS